MQELRSTNEVIDALGGTAATAQIADSSEQQVSNWRALGYFPGNTFLVLSAALVRIGKTASPKLWRMKLPEAAE